MKIQDFYKDFKKGILKDEFMYERKEEFRAFVRNLPRSGKGKFYRPGEFRKEMEAKFARLQSLREARARRLGKA